MAVELDHLFICTELDAPEAERLIAFGLVEGSSNIHPGQGTANRRFFFRNTMLELLWVHAPEEAQSELIRRTRLWERWQGRQNATCPFGICWRSVGSDLSGSAPPAFPTWDYRPPYLPPTLAIAVGTNSEVLTEPMLFQIPFSKRPDQLPPEEAQPLEHPVGLQEITRLKLVSPEPGPASPELQALIDSDQLQMQTGPAPVIVLGFDGERQGQQSDFRPDLPLIIRW